MYKLLGILPNWANAVSTRSISPIDLPPTDDDNDDDNGLPYETVQRRRDKRRRMQSSDQDHRPDRQSSQTFSQPRLANRDGEHQQNQQQDSQRGRRRQTIFGKSTAAVNVAAAKKLRKRAVFCVDNVKPTCSVDDITELVNAWSIVPISCFEVKPRRRRSDESTSIDQKAFRLCIFSEDSEKLLNPCIWPDSVTVSHWYFKSAATQSAAVSDNVQSKRLSMERIQTTVDGGVTAAAAVTATDVEDRHMSDEDGDNTIVSVIDLDNHAVDEHGE